MKVKYLSYKQATALCQTHQHLVGASYDQNEHAQDSIRAVLVAPYSRILQWKFVRYLLQGWPPNDALAINVNDRFDVLVLPGQLQETLGGCLRFKSLRDFIEENVRQTEMAGKLRYRQC